MLVSVFNAEGLLMTEVALRSIVIVGAEHVPQGLTVSLVVLHQACLCYLSRLPMLQTFVQPLLPPLANKFHYLQLLSRPKTRNLQISASRRLSFKTTPPLVIMLHPQVMMMRPLGITVLQPLAPQCLRIVLWHGLMASLT
jgi:hypothetical protein